MQRALGIFLGSGFSWRRRRRLSRHPLLILLLLGEWVRHAFAWRSLSFGRSPGGGRHRHFLTMCAAAAAAAVGPSRLCVARILAAVCLLVVDVVAMVSPYCCWANTSPLIAHALAQFLAVETQASSPSSYVCPKPYVPLSAAIRCRPPAIHNPASGTLRLAPGSRRKCLPYGPAALGTQNNRRTPSTFDLV